MSNSRIPSPARSQGASLTPRRYKTRRTLSVGSPARSTASGRLSAIIQLKEKEKNSFILSPIPTRRSVLNDDTNIEEPRRRSWWKKLDNSRDVMEVLNYNKVLETNEVVEEFIDIEVLSQEKKNYSLDLPESSDSESISSIVIPQRKLFTQKEMQSQDKFAPLKDTRETLPKLQKSVVHEKTIHVPPKNLFNQPSKQKTRPVFPADLLNLSPNKTVNKTKELTTVQVTGQTRNLFGNRPGTKRKNMFAEFIMSESEDEISEIQPKIFGFDKKGDEQNKNNTSHQREPSPTSSITADIEMDDWKLLPSSTMVENQLEDMMAAAKSPARRTRLSKLSKLLEHETKTENSSINKRRKSNTSVSKNNSKLREQLNSEHEADPSLKNKSRKSPNKNETNKSARKNRTNTSQTEISRSKEIDINYEPSSAKRLRLSNSPDKNVTSKSAINASLNSSKRSNKSINKNHSKISSEKQIDENKADSSILTRSKTKDISNNPVPSGNQNIAHKSNIDAQEPIYESIEEDELNMSLIYDEQDEIDSIKSRQKESLKTDSNEKSKEEISHENKNKKVSYPRAENESDNIGMRKDYILNEDDKVIKEIGNKGQKEGFIETGIDEGKNINNHKDISDSHDQEQNQDIQSKRHEVEKLVGDKNRKDSDNNQREIGCEVNKNQNDDINQNFSQGDQDVRHKGNQHAIQRDQDVIVSDQDLSHKEEERESVENINANEETHQSENESFAVDNNDQGNEESREVSEDSQEISDDEQGKAIEDNDETDHQRAESYDKLEQDSEQINQDNDEVGQEREDENEELDNSNQEAEVDIGELEETEQELQGDNEDAAETNQDLEADNEKAAETDQEVEIVNAETDQELEADNEEAAETDQEVEIDNAETDQELETDNGEAAETDKEIEIDNEETDQEVEPDNEEATETDQEVEAGNEEAAETDQEVEAGNEEATATDQEVETDNEETDGIESEPEPENISQQEEDQESEHEQEDSDQDPENVSQEEESQELDEDNSGEEIEGTNENVESNGEITTNISHDTTGRHRHNNENRTDSPEVILHDKTKQLESFTAKGRNTSLRRTSIMKNMNIRPSLAPPRDSTGFSDGSAEGSGWDSHRTTRKTLRQTFGKDFTPRKSLRALVMEKSAKRQTAISDLTTVTSKFPQANSTELPETSNIHDANDGNDADSLGHAHDVSKRTRQTTLETYLQKIKEQNIERKMKIEQNVKNSLKAPIRDISNTFKVPSKPMFAVRKSNTRQTQQKKAKQVKSTLIPLDDLPPEVLEDMKYKPPRRYQPSNAAWITKRLYKFLETKLEPKYDYKARIRAEKLVEAIYQFAKELKRHPAASSDSVDGLKHEMAKLDVVKTHFDFYQFFHDYMPREIRVKVIPDVMNKLPLPRHGVFSDILRVNTIQG